jgi:hypothetical protein
VRDPVASLARRGPLRAASAVLAVLCGCGSSRDAPDAPAGTVDAPAPDATPDGPGTQALPDLQLVAEQMAGTAESVVREFTAKDCEVIEGCVGGPGPRRLLRFDTVTRNRGTADLVVGATPPPAQDGGGFEWSECHGHHHYAGYTSYELLDGADTKITARKQAFCIKDSVAQPGAPPGKFSCFNQGLTRGWSDGYSRGVPCQWIDTTGLPAGQYTLRIVVNPQGSLTESNHDNNVFTDTVTITP